MSVRSEVCDVGVWADRWVGQPPVRPFSLQDESEDPAEFDLRTPPKSPRPKSGSVSPRSGAPAMESSSDSYRATVPMLSRAQGDVNGPAQGVLGPPARLGDSSDGGNQPGGNGDADLVMGDGFELLPPDSVGRPRGCCLRLESRPTRRSMERWP